MLGFHAISESAVSDAATASDGLQGNPITTAIELIQQADITIDLVILSDITFDLIAGDV